jgi:hypothetical protein
MSVFHSFFSLRPKILPFYDQNALEPDQPERFFWGIRCSIRIFIRLHHNYEFWGELPLRLVVTFSAPMAVQPGGVRGGVDDYRSSIATLTKRKESA